jgi:hypothetical protein
MKTIIPTMFNSRLFISLIAGGTVSMKIAPIIIALYIDTSERAPDNIAGIDGHFEDLIRGIIVEHDELTRILGKVETRSVVCPVKITQGISV